MSIRGLFIEVIQSGEQIWGRMAGRIGHGRHSHGMGRLDGVKGHAGAGVGKGRTIAGLILENWRCGRKRHVWLSIGSDLKVDACRDLADIGASFIEVHPLNKLPYGNLASGKVGGALMVLGHIRSPFTQCASYSKCFLFVSIVVLERRKA